MIVHADWVEAPSRTSRLWHDGKYIFAGLAVFLPSLGFYLSSQPDFARDEIVRAEPLEPQGFGQKLPGTGFQVLSLVGPGETFRFQGRVYKTAEGSRPNLLQIVDTGETLSKAGGDPNPKPLPLILSAQTAHPFPNAPQYRPKTEERAADGDRDV